MTERGPADPYGRFARHYDAQQMDCFAVTHGPALARGLMARTGPGAAVLDAGCGTGTLALLLASVPIPSWLYNKGRQCARRARREDAAVLARTARPSNAAMRDAAAAVRKAMTDSGH